MFSFTLLASTLAAFETAIVNRGIAKAVTDPKDGTTSYRGVLDGLEWLQVPNPVITTLAVGTPRNPDGTPNPSYVPAVMDTRVVLLVKCVGGVHDDQIAGLTQTTTSVINGKTVTTKLPLAQRTKLGAWVVANSVADTITSADGRSWPARKVGTNFWFLESPDFGVWQ